MATLLNAVTADTTGTGASHSGPCSVWVRGNLAGGTVVIQGADADDNANYAKLDRTVLPQTRFDTPGNATIAAYGTYYLRAVLVDAGAGASVTVVTTQ